MDSERTLFEPRDENFLFEGKKKVFDLQEAMKTIGCEIGKLEPGYIELKFPFHTKTHPTTWVLFMLEFFRR